VPGPSARATEPQLASQILRLPALNIHIRAEQQKTPLPQSPKRKLRETALLIQQPHSLDSPLGLPGVRFRSAHRRTFRRSFQRGYHASDRMSPISISRSVRTSGFACFYPRNVGHDARAFREADCSRKPWPGAVQPTGGVAAKVESLKHGVTEHAANLSDCRRECLTTGLP
jgi:hypothetical protein